MIAEHFPDCEIHAVSDAAYGCGSFAGFGDGMTMTTRAKVNATFYELAPARTGKRGRPTLKAPANRYPSPTRQLGDLENRDNIALQHYRHREDHRASVTLVRYLAHRARPPGR